MPIKTKDDLERSLKKLLANKPLSKITIKELTDDCNVSRMTFYYHFADIYELARYVSEKDAMRAEQESEGSIKNHLNKIFDIFYNDKIIIMNIYHSLSRENAQKYLEKSFKNVIERLVLQVSYGMNISSEDIDFIKCFCLNAVIGITEEWFDGGMIADGNVISTKIYNAINNLVGSYCVKEFI